MAIPVSPSSGFITRLLQQTTQHTSAASSATSTHNMPKGDTTLISDAARQAKTGEHHQLEDKLIALYNQKGQEQR